MELASARFSMGAARINSSLLDLKFHSAATTLKITEYDGKFYVYRGHGGNCSIPLEFCHPHCAGMLSLEIFMMPICRYVLHIYMELLFVYCSRLNRYKTALHVA